MTVVSAPSRMSQWVPGLAALRGYDRGWLGRDLVAGAVLSALLVPQGMAYAGLAGLPPITGLYTTVVCLIAYALFGPSPYLILGPDSSLGPMIAAAVLPLAAGNQAEAIALAGALALLVGLICIGAGVARLGFIGDLLSMPIRVGYLAGLALTIVVSELPRVFGFSIEGGNLVADIRGFVQGLPQTNPWALVVGLTALVIVFGLQRVAPKAPGILVAVVVTIVMSALLDLQAHGVDVVGVLPQGFPRPALPHVPPADLVVLFAAAIGMTLVTVGDTISTSAAFAARRHEDIDGDQELVGIGSANILAGLFGGFPVSTSSSRTAVAEQSGAKSQLTGVVAAALVFLMIVAAPGLMRNLPQPVLGAVVIVAAVRLFDLPILRRVWTVRRSEFWVAMACILGVTLVGVLQGIVVAVILAVLQVFERAWRPYHAILGEPDDVPGFHDLQRYPDAAVIPGMVVLRWDAPLFFANATLFKDLVKRTLRESSPRAEWLVVAAEPVTDVDTTAAMMLADLDEELNVAGTHLIFAELKDPVKDKLERYGLVGTIEREHFYPTVRAAVKAFKAEQQRATEDTLVPEQDD